MKKKGIVETFVHYATQSDCIHVAILPAPFILVDTHGQIERIKVHNVVFTAFIGHGFEEQEAASVLNPQYEYIFMPVTQEFYVRGMNFLMGLKGKQYNYIDLPFTVLPNEWKKKRTHQCCIPARVFCSQVGLMLCYMCDIVQDQLMDPAYCSPGDLKSILLHHASAIRCQSKDIEVGSDLILDNKATASS